MAVREYGVQQSVISRLSMERMEQAQKEDREDQDPCR